MIKYLFIILSIVIFQAHYSYAESLQVRIYQAALLGNTKEVLKLLPNADQEEVNQATETAAGNGHVDTLKAVMECKNSIHPDQMGIDLAGVYAAHFGDIQILKYILPHLDQAGINQVLVEAAGNGDLNIIDFIIHHNMKGVPLPNQEGMNNAAIEAIVKDYPDALIYLTTHLGKSIPHPDSALIEEIKQEVADQITEDEMIEDLNEDDDEMIDEDPLSDMDVNNFLYQQLIEATGKGFPAPWQYL